jgi:glycine cleavage system pyridoxal-binding protein P
VLATFAAERTHGLLADGESTAAALNGGYHVAYLISAAVVAVATAVALSLLRSPTTVDADSNATSASRTGTPCAEAA